MPDPLPEDRCRELVNSLTSCAGNIGVIIEGEDIAGFAINGLDEMITVTTPAETPLRLNPVCPVSMLWNQTGVFFRTRGIVTYLCPYGMFVQDRSGGTWFDLKDELPNVANGCVVDLIGYRVGGGVGASRDTRICRIESFGTLDTPPLFPIESLESRAFESRRVRTTGELVSYHYQDGIAYLTLKSADHRFTVVAPATVEKLVTLNLETATHLSVSGTVTFADVPEGHKFRLFVPSSSDVEITKRKTVWDNANVQRGLWIGFLALGICVFWAQKFRHSEALKDRDLQSLTAQLVSSYESIRDGVIIVDREQRVLAANQMARDFFDAPLELGGRSTDFEYTLSKQLSDKTFLMTWRRLNDQFSQKLGCEIEVMKPAHRILEVFTAPVIDAQGKAVARVWAFYDVTERKRLQESLLHSQKQEAIGRLAGGIAHDFNNLLAGITGNLYVARMDSSKTIADMRDSLDAAEGASRRAAKLVANLLGFSRKTRLEMRVTNCNTILQRMEPLVRPSIPKEIDLTFELEKDLPNVLADSVQLEQVLLNICLNARDAIDDDAATDSGKIAIKTWTEMMLDHPSVVVSISDTGGGIPEEVRDKIFEPFFTTKLGSGTGLGLAMSEGIVHQHNGTIQFESSAEKGTEFRVILPVTTEHNALLPNANSDVVVSLRGKRVLIVEDDAIVRGVLTRMLESEKATIFSASSGEEATELLCDLHGDEIEIVLLDWKMPGQGGKETLRWIKRMRPQIPVAVCSGYVFDCDEVARESNVAPDAVIQKPFLGPELLGEVKRLLQVKQQMIEQVSPNN